MLGTISLVELPSRIQHLYLKMIWKSIKLLATL